MYKIHVARAYPAPEPNTVLLDNALATMGAGFLGDRRQVIDPTPDPRPQFRPHIPTSDLIRRQGDRAVAPVRGALCGDGGFMMNSQNSRRRYG